MKPMMAILLVTLAFTGRAQDSEEVWYVWIDTNITIEGEQKRLVSEKPFRITCCVKSPDFRKLNKRVVKHIRSQYDADFDGKMILHKIQDPSFAELSIKKAFTEKNIPVVSTNFSDHCN